MSRPPELDNLSRSYRPSVNVARAPEASVPLPFMVAGWGWLLWAIGELLASRASLANGVWSAPSVIAAVHGVTLGFLTMTMTGFLYQWLPVVFDVPALPRWFSWSEGGVYLVGLGLFIDGWLAGQMPRVAVGGGLLGAALLAFAIGAMSRVVRSGRARDTVTAAVFLALLGLTATWVLGFWMAASLAAGRDGAGWLGLHIAVALVAWMATLVSGVQLKLVPMFAMSRVEGRFTALPAALLWAGLGLDATRFHETTDAAAMLWLAAAIFAAAQVITIRRRGRAPEPDTVFTTILAGWVLWAIAALLYLVAPPLAVVAGLTGGTVMVLGYQARLVPFMTALAVARPLPGPPQKAFFLARSMNSRLAPRIISLAVPLGALMLVAAPVLHQALWVAGGAIVLWVGWAGSTGSLVASVLGSMRRRFDTTGGAPGP